MVKQMWYQAKGTLTTGPPPKYLIPESKHSAICLIILYLISIQPTEKRGIAMYLPRPNFLMLPRVDAMMLPIGLPAGSFPPVEIVPNDMYRN